MKKICIVGWVLFSPRWRRTRRPYDIWQYKMLYVLLSQLSCVSTLMLIWSKTLDLSLRVDTRWDALHVRTSTGSGFIGGELEELSVLWVEPFASGLIPIASTLILLASRGLGSTLCTVCVSTFILLKELRLVLYFCFWLEIVIDTGLCKIVCFDRIGRARGLRRLWDEVSELALELYRAVIHRSS